jgi:hypothetical protein
VLADAVLACTSDTDRRVGCCTARFGARRLRALLIARRRSGIQDSRLFVRVRLGRQVGRLGFAARTNASLYRSQGRVLIGMALRVSVFPAAGHYRLPGGRVGDALRARRCAAGLRPVLDPAARSHGMAAARERGQWGS